MGGLPPPDASSSIAKTRSELLALNLRVRGEGPSPDGRMPGLRDAPAWCLARDGSVVRFAAPEDVASSLETCLADWRDSTALARDPLALASACARFWRSFIGIHPFVDGNGRTAKEFLRRELEPLGSAIPDFKLLDRFLMEGKDDELEKLTWLFLVSTTSGRTPRGDA